MHCTKKDVFLKISSVNVTKFAVSADLVTFTEEYLNEKLHFFCCGDIANRGRSYFYESGKSLQIGVVITNRGNYYKSSTQDARHVRQVICQTL